jgi:hypothetical protein
MYPDTVVGSKVDIVMIDELQSTAQNGLTASVSQV